MYNAHPLFSLKNLGKKCTFYMAKYSNWPLWQKQICGPFSDRFVALAAEIAADSLRQALWQLSQQQKAISPKVMKIARQSTFND